MQTRLAHSHPQSIEPTCLICNEPAGSAGVHPASTYIDTNVRRCAIEVEDSALLAKLAAGEMIAIEAINVPSQLPTACVTGRPKTMMITLDLHGIAFAKLMAF